MIRNRENFQLAIEQTKEKFSEYFSSVDPNIDLSELVRFDEPGDGIIYNSIIYTPAFRELPIDIQNYFNTQIK